jgi:hypothetical protein
MNNNQKKELCHALMRADSELEVVRILTEAGLWENRRVWRLYGDRENNFSTIGNQQNRPDAALGEKLVNSVDARLMHECLARGIVTFSRFDTAATNDSGTITRCLAVIAASRLVLIARTNARVATVGVARNTSLGCSQSQPVSVSR